ncbi:NADH dehydrogenase [ubiquinone] 1 alpha subcomplex subunit 6-like [Mytilus galloprovincialis]|uniref:NADH dehydrogenase [ubiquinone] 1 alpha subcomplex subunit 6 n=1 Tax=Mytilus galloprovincialis TaxID=29158 RepID=A0A8B6HE36_MYTGA|nr:NADH dehydrogenase (ubiquinone) 1 alpha subcomplex subunit 6 [Mytilus galloprovincialis]
MASKVATQTISQGLKRAKPILSVDKADAKRRVLNLYKQWYRQIPYSVQEYDLLLTEKDCRDKLKEEFLKNKNVSDIRAIDLLVIKGQMELREISNIWKQRNHVMMYFKDTWNAKPSDFLSKFYEGHQ